MRILVLADVESKYLWDYFEKEKLDGIDLILSCGDLKPQYLSFLLHFQRCLFFMFMAIMMTVMRLHHLMDASVLKIRFMYTVESVLWGLEVL